jgi:hypothetical protein
MPDDRRSFFQPVPVFAGAALHSREKNENMDPFLPLNVKEGIYLGTRDL